MENIDPVALLIDLKDMGLEPSTIALHLLLMEMEAYSL
jgi:hypothetical protein